jgi:hypothetical protein
MCRPRRRFRAEFIVVEERLPLAVASAPTYFRGQTYPTVGFEGVANPGATQLSQMVAQGDGEASVSLSGYTPPHTGTLRVVVATDPSSPAVGVNVGAVAQTVTFTNVRSQATVLVPLLAGAPNPGEVDVDLTITPIDPPSDLRTFGPLELRVVASDAMLPPKIVSVQGKLHAIVLTFSKPMDPVEASNVNNYAISATSNSVKYNPFLVPIDVLTTPFHMDSSISSSLTGHARLVPLQAAEYDPATNSVTLVTKRKLTFSSSIVVTQGHQTTVSGKRGQQSNVGPGLTDLEGNPINGNTTPGKFQVSVLPGTYANP